MATISVKRSIAALKFLKENLSTNFGLYRCSYESSLRNYKKSSSLRLNDSYVFMFFFRNRTGLLTFTPL